MPVGHPGLVVGSSECGFRDRILTMNGSPCAAAVRTRA